MPELDPTDWHSRTAGRGAWRKLDAPFDFVWSDDRQAVRFAPLQGGSAPLDEAAFTLLGTFPASALADDGAQ